MSNTTHFKHVILLCPQAVTILNSTDTAPALPRLLQFTATEICQTLLLIEPTDSLVLKQGGICTERLTSNTAITNTITE